MKNLRMKSARAAMDWSQQQLADAVGVSRQTINAIELYVVFGQDEISSIQEQGDIINTI